MNVLLGNECSKSVHTLLCLTLTVLKAAGNNNNLTAVKVMVL